MSYLLSDTQISLINEISNNKDEYLQLAKEHYQTPEYSAEKERIYNSLVDLYKRFDRAYDNYLLNDFRHDFNQMANDRFQSQKKIDPYIAGGLGQGLGGITGGIAAASSAAAHNAQLDEYRAKSRAYLDQSSQDIYSSQARLNGILRELDSTLNTVFSIRTAREKNRNLDPIYQRAKETLEKHIRALSLNELEEVKTSLISIGKYKDSEELMRECESKIAKKKKSYALLIVLSIIVLLEFMFIEFVLPSISPIN